jgi:hypothetical protein
MNYTTYKKSTGELQRQLVCAPSILHFQLLSDEAAIDGHFDGARFYVVDGQAVERGTFPVTIDGHTLRHLPVPCTVEIEGVVYIVEDGVAELEFVHPGPYAVKLSAVAFMDRVVEIA